MNPDPQHQQPGRKRFSASARRADLLVLSGARRPSPPPRLTPIARRVDWMIVATYVVPIALGWALIIAIAGRIVELAHDVLLWGVH